MRFWEFASTPSLLILGSIIGLMMLLCQNVLFLRNSRLPYSILAGLVCLVGGQQVGGIFFLEQTALEFVVYHGLAITFIAIGLQSPPKGASSSNTIAMGLAMPLMAVIQGLIGLVVVVTLPLLVGEALHPGVGFLLPLGFNQGPGQALSLGEAWGESGLINGGQIGLIMAAIGFGWSIVIGIPLVLWLKRRGEFASDSEISVSNSTSASESGIDNLDSDTDNMSYTLSWVCIVYLLCYGILYLLNGALETKPNLQSMIWGFHYLIALIISVIARKLHMFILARPIHRGPLQQVANISVDWVTCGAIAAIQISILKQNWLPILILSGLGLIVTLAVVMWWSSRGFSSDRAEHAIVWFGTSTGTLPMGLALLRMVDPKLQSSAPTSVALGSMVSLVASIPLLLVIMPYVIDSYPEEHPQVSINTIGILGIYAAVLALCWWRNTSFSLRQPFLFWKSQPKPQQD